jgi:hypothetical protein
MGLNDLGHKGARKEPSVWVGLGQGNGRITCLVVFQVSFASPLRLFHVSIGKNPCSRAQGWRRAARCGAHVGHLWAAGPFTPQRPRKP